MNGALRAMAVLRMVPDGDSISKILSRVRPLEPERFLRFWIAAAAPGWQHPDGESPIPPSSPLINRASPDYSFSAMIRRIGLGVTLRYASVDPPVSRKNC